MQDDPYRLAVLFLDMLIGEHQLSRLTSMPRAARRDKVDETVRLAVKVFLRGCAAPGERAALKLALAEFRRVSRELLGRVRRLKTDRWEDRQMQKIGFIGIGKIGLPICGNLIKGGYAVVGYRRSSLAEFEKLGGVPAQSAADVGAQTDIVFTCLPDAAALDEVVRGPQGLLKSARRGQIVIELGSHRLPVKRRYVALLKERGVEFLDGEVSGTPGMVAQRKGVIYLGGPADAVKTVEPVVAGFADLCMHLGPFGSATKVKLVNNLLVALHIAGTAQAMAIGLKIGVDPDALDKSGRARQRRLDTIRDSRALDGRAPLYPSAGLGRRPRSLSRRLQGSGRRGRRRDAG